MSDLPIVGAALTLDSFSKLRDVMFEKDRDLELQDFHQPAVLDGDMTTLIDQAKKLLDGYGGRHGIHGPFWDLPLAAWDSQVQTLVQNRLIAGLDVCEAIGSTHMVIHSPYTAWDHNNIMHYPDAREGIINRFATTIAPIVKRAEDIGTTLVLENIEDIDPYFRVMLIERVGSNALKVSVDTGHAYYAHKTCGAPPVDYFLKAADHSLHHIHLQDADGYADRHWSLGEGAIAWEVIFRTLTQMPSKPRLIIEVSESDDVERSMTYLQSAGLAQ